MINTLFKYKFNILFRSKCTSSKLLFKKKKTQSITLRAPKHFNIGKHKIFTLNYGTLNFILPVCSKFHINTFIFPNTRLFELSVYRIRRTPTLFVRSVKIFSTTTFKLK